MPHHRDVAAVLVDGLPRPDDIVETEAMVVVRKFSAVEEWDTGLLGPDAVALLRPDGARSGHREWHEPERLTEQEFAIAKVLARRRPGVLRADRRGRRRQRLHGGTPGGVADPARVPALPHRLRARR